MTAMAMEQLGAGEGGNNLDLVEHEMGGNTSKRESLDRNLR